MWMSAPSNQSGRRSRQIRQTQGLPLEPPSQLDRVVDQQSESLCFLLKLKTASACVVSIKIPVVVPVPPALTQALELVNSAEVQRKLTEETGYATRLAASDRSHAEVVSEVFLRVLARPPRIDELTAAVDFLETETDRAEACRSLLWSLLATNEFLFNH